MRNLLFLALLFPSLVFGSFISTAGSPLTTKGDVFTYGTANCRLGVGTDGQFLKADAASACGLKWASAGSGSGNITDINTDATAAQTLTVGTTGTDFAIVDNAAGDHKFNLPSASASNRGLVTTGTQTMAGAKTFSTSLTSPIFSTSTSTPSTVGIFRLAQGDKIGWRDSGNTADYTIGAEGSSLERFTFNNAALFTRSFNGALRSVINNSNVGSSASAKMSLSTNADDLDIYVDSVANGANAGITSQAGITAGFQLYAAAGPLNLRTASGNVLVGSASDNSATFSSTTDASSVSTGAVHTTGGLGVAKKSYLGDQVTVTAGKPILAGTAHLEPLENDAGNSSTTQTIDWSVASSQKSTLTGNVTYTFSNPVAGMTYVLAVYTGAGSFTTTWPGAVHWSGGTTPTTTATASKVDIVTCYYAASTTYFCNDVQNFAP